MYNRGMFVGLWQEDIKLPSKTDSHTVRYTAETREAGSQRRDNQIQQPGSAILLIWWGFFRTYIT